MDIDIEELFEDEIWALEFVRKQFGIPADIFRECGPSYLYMTMYGPLDDISLSLGISVSELPIFPKDRLKLAESQFENLCHSAPHIPRLSIKALSMAYGAYLVATSEYLEARPHEKITMLIDIATVRGTAMSALPFQVEEMRKERQNEKNQILVEAGKKGQIIKNALADELKLWGLEAAKEITGLPTAKARKLMKILPKDLSKKLADAGERLKDPERVIREALFLQRKTKSTAS